MSLRLMSVIGRFGFACLVMLGVPPSFAIADGGTLQVSKSVSDYDIAVFTQPAPLRAGPVDVSVWVQQANTGRLADVQVALIATNRATQQVINAPATHEAATNKLLKSARFELPTSGQWQFEIEVRPQTNSGRGEPTRITFAANVAARLPRWRELAGWIFWPIVPIGLFGAHLYLTGRARRTTSASGEVAN